MTKPVTLYIFVYYMKTAKKIKKEPSALRVAAVDIGTNSTRYMIVEKMADGGLKIVEQGGEITRLGRDLHKTGRLQKPAMKETLDAVKKFIKRTKLKEVERLQIFGTSATRDARNAAEFARAVKKAAKQPLEILTGIEEGELAYDGMIVKDYLAGKPLPPKRWASFTAPTVVIVGGNSEPFFHDGAQTLVDDMPNAERRSLEGQDHAVSSAALAPMLIEFFQD